MTILVATSLIVSSTAQRPNAWDKVLIDRFHEPQKPGHERHLANPTQLRIVTDNTPAGAFDSRFSKEQTATLQWYRASSGSISSSTPKKDRLRLLECFEGYFDSRKHSQGPWWDITEAIPSKYGKRLISYPHSASSSFSIYLRNGGTSKAIVTRIELLVRSDGFTERWLNE
ncbi:MAG TPA: hypothetical protein VK171_08545 [Fimbriimonas sp.]|nr:hypothetical protein [Fimbriimonas sp.]